MNKLLCHLLICTVISGLLLMPINANANDFIKIGKAEAHVFSKQELKKRGYESGQLYLDFESNKSPWQQITNKIKNKDILNCLISYGKEKKLDNFFNKKQKGFLLVEEPVLEAVTIQCNDQLSVSIIPAMIEINQDNYNNIISKYPTLTSQLNTMLGIKDAKAMIDPFTAGIAVGFIVGAIIGYIVGKKKGKAEAGDDDDGDGAAEAEDAEGEDDDDENEGTGVWDPDGDCDFPIVC